MRSRARWFVLATLLVLTVGWLGCGEKGPQINEEAVAEYAALVEEQTALQELRQNLADLRAQAAEVVEGGEEGEGEGEPTEGEAEGGPGLEEQVDAAQRAVLVASEAFNQRIANYFNETDPMLEGEPPSENQAAVLRMKSAEDMVIAGEYIEQGGDYRRAIRIYEDSLQLDPQRRLEDRFGARPRDALHNRRAAGRGEEGHDPARGQVASGTGQPSQREGVSRAQRHRLVLPGRRERRRFGGLVSQEPQRRARGLQDGLRTDQGS